jgi:hypothetical protein
LGAAERQLRVGVVHDCVFDRIRLSHWTALLDMWMKFADLLSSPEASSYLGSGEAGAPDPSG